MKFAHKVYEYKVWHFLKTKQLLNIFYEHQLQYEL